MGKHDASGTRRDLIASHFSTFHIPSPHYVTLIPDVFSVSGYHRFECIFTFSTYNSIVNYATCVPGRSFSDGIRPIVSSTLPIPCIERENEPFCSSRLPGVGRSTPKLPFRLHRVVRVNEYPLSESCDIPRVQLEEAILAVLRWSRAARADSFCANVCVENMAPSGGNALTCSQFICQKRPTIQAEIQIHWYLQGLNGRIEMSWTRRRIRPANTFYPWLWVVSHVSER